MAGLNRILPGLTHAAKHSSTTIRANARVSSLPPHWLAYDRKLPAQIIDLGFVLTEAAGEFVHAGDEQSRTGVLNAASSNAQGFP
jgi:hypothetical protein